MGTFRTLTRLLSCLGCRLPFDQDITGYNRADENDQDDQDITGCSRANDDLYASIALLTEKPARRFIIKHEDETGNSENKQKGLQKMATKYKKVTDEIIRGSMERLGNTSMEPDQDPDDNFTEKLIARFKLEKMGEPFSDRGLKSICVQRFTAEYKDTKLMTYRDPTFDIEQIPSTMLHLHLVTQRRSKGDDRWSLHRKHRLATTVTSRGTSP